VPQSRSGRRKEMKNLNLIGTRNRNLLTFRAQPEAVSTVLSRLSEDEHNVPEILSLRK
jgi:hypothetical protein